VAEHKSSNLQATLIKKAESLLTKGISSFRYLSHVYYYWKCIYYRI